MAGLYAETLGLSTVGTEDSFFDLGGNSLLATRLINRIRSTFQAELSVRVVFESPTVSGLAAQLRNADQPSIPLVAMPRPPAVPLSFAQQRLWFLNQMDGEDAAYNVAVAARIAGELDRDALASALADLADRHDSLRTIFPQQETGPVQRVLPLHESAPRLSVRHLTEAQLPAALAEAAGRRVDLTVDLPLRPTLFVLGPTDHVLLLVLHHIAVDAASMTPLTRDLALAYQARAAGGIPQFSPLPVQYADYALWQRQVLGAESDPDSTLTRQVADRRAALAGLPDELALPVDRARPAVPSRRGEQVCFDVDPGLHQRLVTLARTHDVTVFMLVHAALAALLSRLGAGTDIPIGTPVTARTDGALDDVVGFFVNTVVLRTDTSADPTFAELLARVREADLAAYAAADVPFERLVEELRPARSRSRHPLFQVILALRNDAEPDLELPGLQVQTLEPGVHPSRFDLEFSFLERRTGTGVPGGMTGEVTFDTDLFDRSTVERIAGWLSRLLNGVAAEPDRRIGSIDLLTTAERDQLLTGWNDTAAATPADPLPTLIEEQVRRNPDATAVIFEGTEVSYAELNARANRLAHHLIEQGAGPEQLVALAVPRSAELVVAWLAVLKTGAGYLPVDPGYPAERIEFMLADAAPALVLTTRATGLTGLMVDDPVVATCSDADPGVAIAPANVAYVIYTSGSTGTPKGVAVSHAGIATMALAHADRLGVTVGSRFLLAVSISFDVSLADIALTLLSGAALVVPGPGRQPAGDDLADLIAENAVTHTDLVASMLA
ncbi:MAG: condensation domain-containing protein, partial [Pseudonocardiaceae bacterium]